jgi:hypothetical protein
MRMKTCDSAFWKGGLKDGNGAISTQSCALKAYPHGFSSRFPASSRAALPVTGLMRLPRPVVSSDK